MKAVAGGKGLDGENTNRSGCSQRKRPGMEGLKELYWVESHLFKMESFARKALNLKVRLPSVGTSPFAFVFSRSTVVRLQDRNRVNDRATMVMRI